MVLHVNLLSDKKDTVWADCFSNRDTINIKYPIIAALPSHPGCDEDRLSYCNEKNEYTYYYIGHGNNSVSQAIRLSIKHNLKNPSF